MARTGHIYAYTTPAYRRTLWRGGRWGFGLIKVGYTSRDPHTRIKEQIGASSPEKNPYTLLLTARARSSSGRSFSDKDVHRELRRMGVTNIHNEWFEARPRDVKRALKAVGGKARRGRPPKRRSRRRGRARFSALNMSMVLILAALFGLFAYDPEGGMKIMRTVLEAAWEAVLKQVG